MPEALVLSEKPPVSAHSEVRCSTMWPGNGMLGTVTVSVPSAVVGHGAIMIGAASEGVGPSATTNESLLMAE
jgi:hypothetical protein